MSAGRLIAIIVGALLALLAGGLVIAGGVLLWAYGTQRDAQGFFETADRRVSSSGYALTSPDVDVNIGSELEDWIPRGNTAAVKIVVRSTGDEPLFVGIGPTDYVARYLGDVAHDEITDFGYPSRRIDYESVEGGAPAAPPSQQDFWVVESDGAGRQSIEWDIEDGNWTAVIMNSDAAAGVEADLSLGARFGLLLPIGIALLVGGLVLGGLAAVLVIIGLMPGRRPAPPQSPPAATPAPPPPPAPPTV